MELIDFDLIKKFQGETQDGEIQPAAKNLLTRLGIFPLEIKGDIPNKGPLLIISNHPGGLDSFTLLASVERKDFYFVALSTYQIFGKNLSDRLLPIYRKKSINHYFFEYPLYLSKTPGREKLSLEEAHVRNRETIQKAAVHISAGHAVSIFPMGSVGKKQTISNWKSGVGHLVKQIENSRTQVIFIKIENGGKADLARFLHPNIRKVAFKNKKRTVNISSPAPLKDLINLNKDPREITKKLEQAYNEQWK